MRSADGLVEVHVLSFGARAGYESYLADPERSGHRRLLDGVEVALRVLEATDV